MASGLFLEVEEGGQDRDEEAVKVYLIRFIAGNNLFLLFKVANGSSGVAQNK